MRGEGRGAGKRHVAWVVWGHRVKCSKFFGWFLILYKEGRSWGDVCIGISWIAIRKQPVGESHPCTTGLIHFQIDAGKGGNMVLWSEMS